MNWKIKKIKVSELRENPNNARKLTEKGLNDLEKSILKFGVAEPLVVNTDYVICGGHGRKKILERLKIKEVDCYLPEKKLTKKEFDELGIRLNKNIAGEFDFDILANEFEMDDLIEWGFDESELGLGFESNENEDDVPEVPNIAISKLGDIFEIDGRHRVMCGDSTKANDVERLMDGKKADISFQSPPYNAGDNSLGGNKKMVKSKYANDSDNKTQNDYLTFIILFTTNSLQYAELSFINIQSLAGNKKAVIEYLYTFREHFLDKSIWFKGGGRPAMAESVMNSRFEDIYIFDCNKNPKRVIRTNKFRNISNVFEYNPSGKNEYKGQHAAIYPVKFPQHYISFATKIYSIILDLFLGSGTTLIACQQTNRICYGMELDPIYIDVILKRYKKLYPESEFKCLNRDYDFKKLFAEI